MAKRKTKNQNRPRGGTQRRQSTGSGTFHLPGWRVAWRITLVAAIVGILYWQWPNMASWAVGFRDETIRLFGWGLPLLVIALISLGIVLRLRKSTPLAVRFRQWWGGIAFTFAVWGILAYLGRGGSIGQYLIGFPGSSFIGIPRIIGLILAGIALVVPSAFAIAGRKAASWLNRQLQRRPAPEPTIPQPPVPAPITITPPPRQEPIPPATPSTPVSQPIAREKQAVITPPTLVPTREELRQVAQEVWKKYGESPSLVTDDGWRLPPIDILDSPQEIEFGQADNLQRARLIEEALASYGVEAKVVQINAGPTVTQFGVEPGWDRKMKEIRERDKDGNVTIRLEEVSKTRVKVDRITALANDLTLALAAPSIRIEAPVPGKPVVGIEFVSVFKVIR